MNRLSGVIEEVESNGSLSLVKVRVGESLLTSIIIDTPQTNPALREGHPVKILFKETEVVIGCGSDLAVSLQNQLSAQIKTLAVSALLARVCLNTSVGEVVAIITANAVKELGLIEGMEVKAMIKTNELMLAYD